eukprot:GFUD01095770.1.p1 GENE.GFUD01095770.1~~GFUD01095770.1.p1  ORF type:complete len:106 (-),score=25.82 GFUD01095770.1:219-536(-)
MGYQKKYHADEKSIRKNFKTVSEKPWEFLKELPTWDNLEENWQRRIKRVAYLRASSKVSTHRDADDDQADANHQVVIDAYKAYIPSSEWDPPTSENHHSFIERPN